VAAQCLVPNLIAVVLEPDASVVERQCGLSQTQNLGRFAKRPGDRVEQFV
jgi:hypothetical protein